MKERLKIERHEAIYGPHFNEECAMKAVSKMENEDGTIGEHWDLDEAISFAEQYGVNLKTPKFNKYDWYVALNMVYSDFYRTVITITNSDYAKHFVDLAKAWLMDKDIEEGKMWYYYCYVMCDKLRMEMNGIEYLDEDDEEFRYARGSRGRGRGRSRMASSEYGYDDEDEYYNLRYELRRMREYEPTYKRISRY